MGFIIQTAADDELKEEKTYNKVAFQWEPYHIEGLLQLDFEVCAQDICKGFGFLCYILTSVATSYKIEVPILRKPVMVINYFHLHNIALSKQYA